MAALRILFQRGARADLPRREIHYASKFPTDPSPRATSLATFSLIAFQIFRSTSSFFSHTAILDGRANVKQWKIFERSPFPAASLLFPISRLPLPPSPIFACELNNVFFFSFFSFSFLLSSCMLTSFDRRVTVTKVSSRKFQRVQTSDFSEGGYVVRAQGLDSEVTGKSEASMPNEGLSAPQGALAQRRYTAAPSQRPQDSTQTVSLLFLPL